MKFAPLAVLTVAGLSLASCTSVAASAARDDGYGTRDYESRPLSLRPASFHIYAYARGEELDELEFEEDNTDIVSKVRDVERDRAGIVFEFGGEAVRGFFQIFEEDFDAGGPEFDGLGFGGGVAGAPTIRTYGIDQRMLLPYRAEFNFVSLDRDSPTVANQQDDLAIFDSIGEVGIAYDWRGLQPGVGITATAVGGILEAAGAANDSVLTGFNFGGYAGVKYKHPNFPMWVEARAIGGDVSGALFRLGVSF